MNQNQNQAMAMLQCGVQGLNIAANGTTQATYTMTSAGSTSAPTQAMYYQGGGGGGGTLWNYWQDQYFPQVILQSYPVYIQHKAMDKGKQAFEILKALMDKGLVKIDKVKDFIEAMDTLLKTL